MKNKYDLFISYSRADIIKVKKLVGVLSERIPELTYWFDIDGIESASEFEDKIIAAINQSSFLLFAMSDNSMKSEWSKDEVTYAKNIGKKVIPVLLDGTTMKEGWFLFKFGRIDCIDLTDEMQFEKLISDLSRWINKPSTDADNRTRWQGYMSRCRRLCEKYKEKLYLAASCVIAASAILFSLFTNGNQTGTDFSPAPVQHDMSTAKVVPADTLKPVNDPDRKKDSVAKAVRQKMPVQKQGTPKPMAPVQKKTEADSRAVVAKNHASLPKISSDRQETPTIPAGRKVEKGYINGHKFVDLGLSVKWAECNIGASAPYEYGDYFAWGEIEPKSEYTDSNSVTYRMVIGEIAGDKCYDAATALWGVGWRLPSRQEIKELQTQCRWTFVTRNGHNGFEIVAPNGNSIFLPLSGVYRFDKIDKLDGGACYMSSTASPTNDRAYGLVLKGAAKQHFISPCRRFVGQSIRPVSNVK